MRVCIVLWNGDAIAIPSSFQVQLPHKYFPSPDVPVLPSQKEGIAYCVSWRPELHTYDLEINSAQILSLLSVNNFGKTGPHKSSEKWTGQAGGNGENETHSSNWEEESANTLNILSYLQI